MPVGIEITVTGTPPNQFTKILEETIQNVDASLAKLADGAVDHMRQVIKSKTYRSGSTGNLSESIMAYKIDGGYGIGDKTYLKTAAPYWALMNYGGLIAQKYFSGGKYIFGNFEGNAPNTEKQGSNPGGGDQRFTKGVFPLYPMAPGFPVMPKNYIEDTVSWLVSYIDGYNFASKQ